MKIFFCTLLISVFAQAASVKVFVSLNPAGDFVAETDAVSGNAIMNENGTVEASQIKVDVKTLKTGIGLRDRHLAEKYLDAANHPHVVLKIAKGSGGKGQAILIIKGKEGKVAGTYGTSGTALKAEFTLKVSDFGITDVSYKGVGVEDEVKVVAIVPLVKKKKR